MLMSTSKEVRHQLMSILGYMMGYQFSNEKLLLQALTRTSAINENLQSSSVGDFQRLEFLGDKVLGVVVSDVLFENHPDWREGQLTTEVSRFVCNDGPLAVMARNLCLGTFLIMGSGEEKENKARENEKVLSDSFEALVGAIWLDSGKDYWVIRSFLLKQYQPLGLVEHIHDVDGLLPRPPYIHFHHDAIASEFLSAPNHFGRSLTAEVASSAASSSSTSSITTRLEELTVSTVSETSTSLLTEYPVVPQKITNELVKSCLIGDLKEVSQLVFHGMDVNQVDPSGMTPLLAAYWGLNLVIMQFLGEYGAIGITSEQADQKLKRSGRHSVTELHREVCHPQSLYNWMIYVDQQMYGARGVVESYTTEFGKNAMEVWNRKKTEVARSIEEEKAFKAKGLRIGYCPSASDYPQGNILFRKKECEKYMASLESMCLGKLFQGLNLFSSAGDTAQNMITSIIQDYLRPPQNKT